MSEIYNEGRVVGYSAEELFDKLFHEKYPDEVPPTTKEWLSASMGMGASFALHINKTTDTKEVLSYNFRSDSSNINNNLKGLSARYLIIATPIYGTATTYGSGNITPISKIENINTNVSTSYNANVSGYSHILNGIVVYPNQSSNNTVIKLLIDGPCTCDILFTGFLNRKIVDVLKLSAGADSTGSTYTDIDDFGDTLMPDISQIFFARPNFSEYFKANVINTTDTQGSMIDISQVNNNSSTLSTSASIITPTGVSYANETGVQNIVPNLFSIQQHIADSNHNNQKVNPSLYFYNPATNKLEPVDSDAKGAVNIIKRSTFTNATTDLNNLVTLLQNMTSANPDKLFLGGWLESSSDIYISKIVLPDSTIIEPYDLPDFLEELDNSSYVNGVSNIRLFVSQPTNYTYQNGWTYYGIWD